MKIVLKNEQGQNEAKTYIENNKWWFVGYIGRWVDSFKKAFDYEFCDDAPQAWAFGILQNEINDNMTEILRAYAAGQEEYIFYL